MTNFEDSEIDFEDFEFPNIDFSETKEKYIEIDICGLVQKMKQKKRVFLNINREANQLSSLIDSPPCTDEVYKMLSVGGGFSSLGIIKYIAELETIDEMYVSTFRIGKKHFETLCRLKEGGKINRVLFVTSQTQEKCDEKMTYKGKKYNYYDFIVEKCKAYDWEIKSFDNHSKIILMKTKNNFYVVETSSNLNENPKMEQFSFENDKKLYEWYKKLFIELLKNDEEEKCQR